MKRILFLLLFPFLHASAQNLTGIWRGIFYSSQLDVLYGNTNKYEVQIDNAERALKGVTYSYQNTTFYGKSSLIGIWSATAKTLTFKEDKLLEFRITSGGDDVYMFTCYLEYRREGDKEILEGTYTTEHHKTHQPGGGGKIYLEKVTTSDFKKEDFIIRKEQQDSQKAAKPPVRVAPPVVKQNNTSKPVNTPKTPSTVKKTTPGLVKPSVKPKPDVVKAEPKKQAAPPIAAHRNTDTTHKITKTDPPKTVVPKPVELPTVLKERHNDLVRTIVTTSNEIEVSLYDNGEIDGDTISVFLNGRLIASHRGLSLRPITLKIKIDEENPEQEITMVAENLGTIPPNTALMIVKAGDQRFDLRISSSNQNNAVVRFRFQGSGGSNK